jgi:AcrR family transcriptional regulator
MGDVKGAPGKRRYQSPVREESARRTRQAIVAAAAGLFASRGYPATSLADIAAAAGVARPTVFATFGSKGALLRQVLDEALAGDDEPVPVADRPWFRPVWEAPTQAGVLDAYARVCTVIGGRAALIFEAVRRAADSSAELSELWDTLQANRRAGAHMVVRHLETFGPLRPGLGTITATDRLWICNDPAHYHALVRQCGWPEPEFTVWLAGQMRHSVLAVCGPGNGVPDRPA